MTAAPKPRDWAKDLAQGKAGEEDPKVRKALAKLYPGLPIQKASAYWDRQGVDLIVDRPSFPVPVQVKSYGGTYHPARTASVFVEDISDLDRGKPGWLWTSQAEVLVIRYGDGVVLVLHLPTLRLLAEAQREAWGDYLHITETRRGKSTWYSAVWRLPLHEVRDAILVTLEQPPDRAKLGMDFPQVLFRKANVVRGHQV